MWRVGPVTVSFSSGSGDSSFRKKKRRRSVPVGVSEPKRSKVEDVVIIEDPEFLAAIGVLEVNEKEAGEAGDSDDESNLSKLVVSADGIQKIGVKWLTLVESDKIESVMKHLIQNNISPKDISNLLPESLTEILKERMSEQYVEEKGLDMQSLLNECTKAKNYLSIYIEELRDCIRSASRIYRYCISWPTTAVKYKGKIDAIEKEMTSLGKSFDFLNDKDGEQRKRVNSIQTELRMLQRQKEDFVSMFWRVKEIVEAKLEHFSALLEDTIEYEKNPTAPDNFSNSVDLLIERRSLSVSIKLAIRSWEVLPELKEKYKLIFPKNSS